MVRWWFRDRGELPFALEIGIKEQEPGFLFLGRQSWVLIWRLGLTLGALLLDNLNLFQAFSQVKREAKHANLFSTLSVETGYNELNTCSINTYSNCILANHPSVLATARGMGQYFDNPFTRSPYVAFGLSSLFPQTGGATSTAHRSMTSFACQPALGGAWSNFRGQD